MPTAEGSGLSPCGWGQGGQRPSPRGSPLRLFWLWGRCAWVPAWGRLRLGVSSRRMAGRSRWQRSRGCISLCGGGAVAHPGGARGPPGFAGARDPATGTGARCPAWRGLLAPGPSLGKRGLGRQVFPLGVVLGLGEASKRIAPGVIYASFSTPYPVVDDLTAGRREFCSWPRHVPVGPAPIPSTPPPPPCRGSQGRGAPPCNAAGRARASGQPGGEAP